MRETSRAVDKKLLDNNNQNKGVISYIEDDEDMYYYIDDNGEKVYADLVLNPLGVNNRINHGQLNEVELNFIADNISRKMRTMSSYKEKTTYFFDFIKEVNKTQYAFMKKYFKNLSTNKEKRDFIDNLCEKIECYQPPFWDNLGFDDFRRLYEKYDFIKPYKVYYKGKEVQRPLIIAEMYMIKLRHDPSSKFSSRSTSYINMKNSPSKSLSFKKHEAPYSKTPIRLGEMELLILLMTKRSDILAKFNSHYSNNEDNRQHTSEQLITDNIFDIEELTSVNTENSNRIQLDVLLKTLGTELVEDDEE